MRAEIRFWGLGRHGEASALLDAAAEDVIGPEAVPIGALHSLIDAHAGFVERALERATTLLTGALTDFHLQAELAVALAAPVAGNASRGWPPLTPCWPAGEPGS